MEEVQIDNIASHELEMVSICVLWYPLGPCMHTHAINKNAKAEVILDEYYLAMQNNICCWCPIKTPFERLPPFNPDLHIM